MTRVTAVPRSDRIVTLNDGRSLAYADWGDLGGRPVVLILGTPGSRLLCPDADATEALGVRLITIDRPGYGHSDPDPDFSLRTWADDYTEFHGLLGLSACPLVGWSGGGPYALASAVLAPALVTSVGLVASDAPLDELADAWGPEERRLGDLLRRDRAAGLDAIVRYLQWYADDPVSIFRDGWEGPDEALLAQPGVRDTMIEWTREGARQGAIGYVADIVAKFDPAGFSASDVTQEVGVWVGEADAPWAHAAATYFLAAIPRATLVTYQDTGHLLAIPHWAEILTWLH